MNRFAKLAAIRGLVRLPQPIARLFWMCLLGLWLWVFGIAGLKSLNLFGLVPSDWPLQYLGLPFALAVFFLAWFAETRLALGQRYNPKDPEDAKAGFIILPLSLLAVPAFLDFFGKGWVREYKLGGALIPDAWPDSLAAAAFLAMVAGAFGVVDIIERLFAAIPKRHKREIVTAICVALGAFFVWAWWTNWQDWGGNHADGEPNLLSYFAGAAFLALAILAWNRESVSAASGRRDWLAALMTLGLGTCMFYFVAQSLSMLRFGFRSPIIADGKLLQWAALGIGPFVILALVKRWFGRSSLSTLSGTMGKSSEGSRKNLSLLSWSQVVGTGESKGQSGDRMVRYLMLGTLLGGAGVGFFVGGWQGAAIGAFIGGWFASLAPRDAAVPDLRLPIQGSAGTPRAPRPLTDQERQQLAEPVTRREDCEAFLEESGDEIYFCVACGDGSKGALPVVDRVPWDSFINFEESSHKQWFRPRGVASDMLDWGVIIAQSNTGRIVRVAESVTDHASLIELLVKLQNTFISPREGHLKAFRERVKARTKEIGSGPPAGHPTQDVPVKPF